MTRIIRCQRQAGNSTTEFASIHMSATTCCHAHPCQGGPVGQSSGTLLASLAGLMKGDASAEVLIRWRVTEHASPVTVSVFGPGTEGAVGSNAVA